ncbi:unnamed protein product, partial [Ascophyllum nodosum]
GIWRLRHIVGSGLKDRAAQVEHVTTKRIIPPNTSVTAVRLSDLGGALACSKSPPVDTAAPPPIEFAVELPASVVGSSGFGCSASGKPFSHPFLSLGLSTNALSSTSSSWSLASVVAPPSELNPASLCVGRYSSSRLPTRYMKSSCASCWWEPLNNGWAF